MNKKRERDRERKKERKRETERENTEEKESVFLMLSTYSCGCGNRVALDELGDVKILGNHLLVELLILLEVICCKSKK